MAAPKIWTDEEVALLIKCYDLGISDKDIAAKLNKSTTAVRNKRTKLNLRRDGHGRPEDNHRLYEFKKPIVEKKHEEKMRRCLGPDCGRMFKSTWHGNRLCPRCKPS